MNITTVGIDLAKLLFQAHGVDARGKVLLRKRLKRSQVVPFFSPRAATQNPSPMAGSKSLS